jgi:Pvc16 N-terminal domain/Carboxypeptidase regulatory-like domain
MIRDLSLTLRAILDQPGLPPELAEAQIVFDRPTEPFAPSPKAVDLFLYDIRENVDLRSNEPIVERFNGQARIHRPPLRVACSYLVTAWPTGDGDEESALQEHRLLSQVLALLSRYPTIPQKFLKGKLIGQEPPLPMMTAQTSGLQNPAEFWTAIGNKLRASLTVTVTIAIPVLEPEDAAIVISREVALEQQDLPLTRETFFHIGGRVTDVAGKPVEGASVSLDESGLPAIQRGLTSTDAHGRYRFSGLSAGSYHIRVQYEAGVAEVDVTVPAPADSNYDVQLA